MKSVSIIVAAYNIENYIEKCLNSLLKQSLDNIEIIVVNDGSTDSTPRIIEKISNNNINKVIVVNQKNKGLGEARKSGLKIAKGEYLLFVDGDDWLEEVALEKLYISATNNNSDIVLYNAFWSYDDRRDEVNTFNDNINELSDLLRELFRGNITPAIWAKLIKREYINKNNIQFVSDCSYAEDLATVSSWFMYNPKISFVKESLYNYYQRSSSITKKMSNKVLEVDKALRFIKQELINNNLYNTYIIEYEYVVFKHLFEYQFLRCNSFNYLHEQLYKQFVDYNININKNEHISNIVSDYPLSLKIKVNSYLKNYKYGKLYDELRKRIKNEL